MSQKDEIYSKILNCALRLDFKKGHLRWTLSELARLTPVTRTLIYYYFGKSKEEILIAALKLIGEEIFGLNPQRLELWSQKAVEESVYRSRDFVEGNPHLIAFYFAHRMDESDIGRMIRKLEEDHRKKLARFIPGASSERIEALSGLLLGLVIAPKISRPAIQSSVRLALATAEQGSHRK